MYPKRYKSANVTRERYIYLSGFTRSKHGSKGRNRRWENTFCFHRLCTDVHRLTETTSPLPIFPEGVGTSVHRLCFQSFEWNGSEMINFNAGAFSEVNVRIHFCNFMQICLALYLTMKILSLENTLFYVL